MKRAWQIWLVSAITLGCASSCQQDVLLGQRCDGAFGPASCAGTASGDAGQSDSGSSSTGTGSGVVVAEPASEPLGTFDLESSSLADFCAGQGAPMVAKESGTCAPDLFDRLFGAALCTCSDAPWTGVLNVDAFDSRAGSAASGNETTRVGINGALTGGALSVILTASLVVADRGPLEINAVPFTVSEDLWTHGEIRGFGASVQVGRDAHVAGNIALTAALQVGRDLYQPATATNVVPPQVTGTHYPSAVAFDPPCPCEEQSRFDVAGLVEQARVRSDNATAGVTAGGSGAQLLATLTQAVDCGRFYIPGDVQWNIPVRVRGRMAIFVEGDLSITLGGSLELEPGAELDLFVGGSLTLGDLLSFGPQARPAALRVYVAGEGLVRLASSTPSMNLYAPAARVEASGFPTLYGAVFARELIVTGTVTHHHDRAILEATCSPNP